MNITACTVSIEGLAAEVLAIPLERIPDRSGSSHFDGPDRWIHGLSMRRITSGINCPLVTKAITELRAKVSVGPVVQIMVNKLQPGALLDRHKDGYPDHARYHLPVITNHAVYWWDELHGRTHMPAGFWHGPVPYCGILHSAGNPGPTERIHVIVDFERH